MKHVLLSKRVQLAQLAGEGQNHKYNYRPLLLRNACLFIFVAYTTTQQLPVPQVGKSIRSPRLVELPCVEHCSYYVWSKQNAKIIY